uniref:DUF5004 domain-containing protein n=1 Tax=Mucilaginibacter sp. Bleaf8 TaxID=2834430 RepID=UPI0020C0F538|nr:DUF5004 domain-containing protein [Mucilaginibacter sp. Bleaf8]
MMKIQIVLGRTFLLAIICAMMCFSSCKTEQIVPSQEMPKDISGNWKVIKATRNGTDITNLVDFSKFQVAFNEGKYTLINKLPFLVNQDGTYSLDNPQYPFQIVFRANGTQPIPTAFNYPIVNGVRQLSLTFSPGCPNNTYIYTLEKATK